MVKERNFDHLRSLCSPREVEGLVLVSMVNFMKPICVLVINWVTAYPIVQYVANTALFPIV